MIVGREEFAALVAKLDEKTGDSPEDVERFLIEQGIDPETLAHFAGVQVSVMLEDTSGNARLELGTAYCLGFAAGLYIGREVAAS